MNILGPIDGSEKIVLRAHSELVYWWIIWLYCIISGILSQIDGVDVAIGEGKPVSFHTFPWLGIFFIALLVLVVFVTHANLRGPFSLLLIALIALGISMLANFTELKAVVRFLSQAVAYMNEAFYVLTAAGVFLTWAAVLMLERYPKWVFSPAKITVQEAFLGEVRTYSYKSLQVRRCPFDLIVYLLGLGLFRDIEVTFDTPSGRERHVFTNVFNGNKLVERLRALPSSSSQQPALAAAQQV